MAQEKSRYVDIENSGSIKDPGFGQSWNKELKLCHQHLVFLKLLALSFSGLPFFLSQPVS
jgi:hypothetical protein